MITAKLENNELAWQGEVVAGDIYPNHCCPGFDWEIVLAFPDSNPGYVSIWGRCHNPNCPDWDGSEGDPYRGVSNILLEDFAGRLASGESRHPAAGEGNSVTADSPESAALWQARAERLLDVFVAALSLVDRKAIVTDRNGGVVVGREQYERLRARVEAYRRVGEGEAER